MKESKRKIQVSEKHLKKIKKKVNRLTTIQRHLKKVNHMLLKKELVNPKCQIQKSLRNLAKCISVPNALAPNLTPRPSVPDVELRSSGVTC